MNWTIPLLEAIDQYDPEFRRVVVPADRQEIEILSDVLGLPLPEVYTEFLLSMGNYDGGLFWQQRVIPDIAEVIAYSRRHRAKPGPKGSLQVVPFAVGIDFDGFGLRLAHEVDDHPVVILNGMDPGEKVCSSMPALAWSHAFLYEAAAAGRIVIVRALERRFTVDQLHAMLAEDGYKACWFGQATKCFFRRGRVLLTLYKSRSGILQIQIGSVEEAVIRAALVDLRRLIGAYKYDWVEATTLPQARLGRRDVDDYQVS